MAKYTYLSVLTGIKNENIIICMKLYSKVRNNNRKEKTNKLHEAISKFI